MAAAAARAAAAPLLPFVSVLVVSAGDVVCVLTTVLVFVGAVTVFVCVFVFVVVCVVVFGWVVVFSVVDGFALAVVSVFGAALALAVESVDALAPAFADLPSEATVDAFALTPCTAWLAELPASLALLEPHAPNTTETMQSVARFTAPSPLMASRWRAH